MRLVLLAALVAAPALAQEPKRPRVEGDSNSAIAYYEMGARLLVEQPEEALNAFYWAARIDPEWPAASYGLRIAQYNVVPRLLAAYPSMTGRMLEAADVMQIDSLQLRAEVLDPFFPRDLERQFLERTIAAQLQEAVGRGSGSVTIYVQGGPVVVKLGSPDPSGRGQQVDPLEIDLVARQILGSNAAFLTRGIITAGAGRHENALDQFRRALVESRVRPLIHAERARAFHALGRVDSAVAALEAAIAELARPEQQRFARLYQTAAAYRYAIGVIRERAGQGTEARAAYEQALAADSAFYGARFRLGVMAFAARDTAAALSQMERAVNTAPREVTQRVTYGLLLAQAGRGAAAVEQLRLVTGLEPHYAWAYYVLGRVTESGEPVAAAAAYRTFLALATADHPRRADATQRLARLASGN